MQFQLHTEQFICVLLSGYLQQLLIQIFCFTESSKEQSKSDINPDSASSCGDPCSSKERTSALVGSSTAQKGDDRFKNKLQMRPDEALGEHHCI